MKEIANNEWGVCVRTWCYNHASYILDAMNGLACQQTRFPYVCCIVDDASTDGSQEIINHFFEMCFETDDKRVYTKEETDDYLLRSARHRLNKNCFFVVIYLKYNHHKINKPKNPYLDRWKGSSKYLALCEGDDFWISSNKLQLQYEVLEAHPNYSMCCHNAIKLFMNQKIVRTFNENICEGVLDAATIINKWSIPTASMFYRREYDAYPDWLAHIYSGDMALYLRCFGNGEIYYFDDIMSVYRCNTKGSSSSAQMKGKEIFIMEQHNILLDSFNKGTSYRFDAIISKQIKRNNLLIKYEKKRIKGMFYCLFEPALYQLVFRKIQRMIKA